MIYCGQLCVHCVPVVGNGERVQSLPYQPSEAPATKVSGA